MRLLAPLVLALLLAGCVGGTSTRTRDVTVSTTSSFEHDYRDGADGVETLEFPHPGTLRFTATFQGVDAGIAGMHLCPDDADVVIEVLAPDGSVRHSVDPEITGLNGTGGCGAPEREVRVAEPGAWALRFRGRAEMSVRGEAHVRASSSG